MKKFFGILRDMLWRHKLLSIICFMATIVIIILIYMFCSIFVGSSDKYGHRLNGIEKVKISKSELSEIEDKVESDNHVSSVDIRVEGKIIYIDIIYTDDTNLDDAKKIASSTIDNFSDSEKEFYDFGYVLAQSKDDGFKIAGAKTPKSDKVSFTKS